MYGIPLTLLIVGAVIASTIFADPLHQDRNVAVGALMGLFAGYLWLKGHNQFTTINPQYRPVILRLAESSSKH